MNAKDPREDEGMDEREAADRRWFELPPEAFAEFEQAVDAPVQEMPKLRALLTEDEPRG